MSSIIFADLLLSKQYSSYLTEPLQIGIRSAMPHADATQFPQNLPRSELYSLVLTQVESLLEGQLNWIVNTANVSSLLHYAFLSIPLDVNWTGFYILPSVFSNTLLLGPFQGKVACQSIPIGKGVCGASAQTGETIIVPDVLEWDGHIACDSDSRSEIVVPIKDKEGQIRGVLDVDCRSVCGFSAEDQEGLERIMRLLGEGCQWP
jgi:L-methionine (R)-S-oxide reductase